MPEQRRIRVLIVDDSALVRNTLANGLAADPEIEVVGTARDPYEARDLLVRERPDVLTLDVEMPRMDGVTFLRKVMALLPTPTVVLSSLTTASSDLAIQALEAGAVDVVAKPSAMVQDGLKSMMAQLAIKVKTAARTKVSARAANELPVEKPTSLSRTTDLVIGLGASTGGVAALGRILPAFPADSPGIVIVQHMPAGFTSDFARRLAPQCAMKVEEARHGDRVKTGHILVAPGGDRHLEVRRFGGEYRVSLYAGPPVSGHLPSVDVFFSSLAQHVGANAAACLLTGMGSDGALGLAAIRRGGGRTLVQDQATSAVWGMPGAAVDMGAAEKQVPLDQIPAELLRALRRDAREAV